MEFPSDIVDIISAYSKPISRPNWREGTPSGQLIQDSFVSNWIQAKIDILMVQYYILTLSSTIEFT